MKIERVISLRVVEDVVFNKRRVGFNRILSRLEIWYQVVIELEGSAGLSRIDNGHCDDSRILGERK